MKHQTKWLRRATLAVALAAAIPAFQASAAVVTSIRPLGFIAAAIADGVLPTEVLLPDGASPHDYALRPSDVQNLRKADLVIWVGPDMEGFLTKSLQQVDSAKQIALSELPDVKKGLIKDTDDDDDHEHGHDHAAGEGHGHDEHHHGEYNMHIWLSPDMAETSAVAIHQKLVERFPEKKSQLDGNLHKFQQELQQTNANIDKMLKPVQGKGYFVFHDAYGYFENHFGLKQLGHFTVNPEIQPGAQHLHQIRTQLVEQKANCIFAEPQFRPAVIKAVAQGTNVHIGTLDPLGSGIALERESYVKYLSHLSEQFVSCLKDD